MTDDFIGSGLAFPLRPDARGGLALVSGEQKIQESIRLILGTAPGERPMRPEFGCAIHDLVFAPLSPSTIGRIALEVRHALRRWEPRIDVHDVEATVDRDEPAKLLIGIRYTIRRTNDPRNLVFPFYAIPAEEGRRAAAAAPA